MQSEAETRKHFVPAEHPAAQSTCPAAMWMSTSPGNHAHLRDKRVKTAGTRYTHFTQSTVTLLSSAADAAAPSLTALNVWPFPNRSAHLTLPWEVGKVENASLILNCDTVEHNESQQWQAVTLSGMHAKYAATLASQARKKRHFLRWEIYWNANRPRQVLLVLWGRIPRRNFLIVCSPDPFNRSKESTDMSK